nr:UL27 [Anatid alphaherpesvirus 1]
MYRRTICYLRDRMPAYFCNSSGPEWRNNPRDVGCDRQGRLLYALYGASTTGSRNGGACTTAVRRKEFDRMNRARRVSALHLTAPRRSRFVLSLIMVSVLFRPIQPQPIVNATDRPHGLMNDQDTHLDGERLQRGKLSARELIRGVQSTREEDKFYVCPPPTGTTVLRFEPSRKCPEAYKGRNWTEGVAVIFKENINPLKFKAMIYYKNVIQTTTWSGTWYKQITNRYTDRVPVALDEITDRIDRFGKCLSAAKYLRNNVYVDAFDRDESAKEVPLLASRFNTPDSRAWHTTNDTYTVFGSPWIYRTSTSVNCIVEEVMARSAFPYDYFALANGDVVNMSPFYGYGPTESREHNSYSSNRYKQLDGYKVMDLDTHRLASPIKRNFLTTEHYTVGWDWMPKRERVCSMAKWQEVNEMMRAEYGTRYRFASKTLSASFISNMTQFNLDRLYLGDCVKRDSEEAIKRIFEEQYASTHVKAGAIEYYLTSGGFILAYQPVVSNTLVKMYVQELTRDNRTELALDLLGAMRGDKTREDGRSRHARSVDGGPDGLIRGARNIDPYKNYTVRSARVARNADPYKNTTVVKSVMSAQFAMLQYTYDHIQAHVNDMLSRIAVSWCELQNKESVLWAEMRKVNPSLIASTTVGRRVGARMLGDVLAVSSCIEVPSSQISLSNSMHIPGGSSCYSRPPVTFSYEKDGGTIDGMLGENNELLLTREYKEPCAANHKRYFMFGPNYVLYEEYQFVRQVEAADIQMVSTFVELNLTMLEDREILPLQVYTREEIRDSGVLDYAEVQRRNQLHSLRFYDIDKVIDIDSNYAFMADLTNFFKGLGEAGQAIGKVVVGVAGAVVSTVSGISSLLSNPFGALAIGLIVVAGLVVAFLAYRYISKLRNDPMKTLYPMTMKTLKNEAKLTPRGEADGEDEDEFDESKLEQAREMVRYMALLSASERTEKKARKKNSRTALLSNHLSNLRSRSNGKKYSKVEDEYEDGDSADETEILVTDRV